MKRTSILFAFAFFAWIGCRAQDVHFSQFYNAPLMTNPALTGAFNAEHRVIVNYRNQWATIGKPYTTYAVSYDAGILKSQSLGFLGLGLQFFADRAGDLNMGITQINLSVAYHLALNQTNFLTAGLQGGYSQRSINEANMRWGNQYNPLMSDGYDPSMSSGEPTSDFQNSYGVGDISAGMLWTFNNSATNMSSNDMIKGNAGIGLFHLNQPTSGFYKTTSGDMTKNKLSIRTTVHSNFLFGIPNTNTSLVPSLLLNVQGKAREFLIGSLVRFRLQEKSKYTNFVSETAFSIGVHYRCAMYLINKEYNGQSYKSFTSDAIIAEAMFDIKNWSIGLSYDANVSKLSAASKSMGGFEVALRYMTPIFKKSDKSLY